MAAFTKFLKPLLLIVLFVLSLCALRTLIFLNMPRKKLATQSGLREEFSIELTDERWDRLRDSLRFKTVTHNLAEIRRFLTYIIEAHPTVFKSDLVNYEVVNGYSLLVHIQGTNRSLVPYLLAAHLDVVPAVESQWSVDPFNGTEDEAKTKVYGRGSLDTKGSLMAHLAAVEVLLDRGLAPKRSFYLAYGHDEEVFGPDGAPEIAKTLQRKGVRKLHFVLDEGAVVLKDFFPGMEKSIALIGVSEKGMMTLNLTANIPGSHSSMPEKETAPATLGRAVHRLQSNQMPGRIDSLVGQMLENLTPELKFPANVLTSNLWLFRPLLWRLMGKHAILQGFVRSTTAVTIFRAGSEYNVIPSSAWALVNHRVHQMDSKAEVLEHDRSVISDDRINITLVSWSAPHPVSPFDPSRSLPYQILTDTVEQIFENVTIVPGTLQANTDTRAYLDFTEHIYRFNPLLLTSRDVSGIHAEDEAISRKNFKNMISFFYRLIRNADSPQLREAKHKDEL